MDFNKIIEKHGYSEELGDFLKQIYDEFVVEFDSDYECVIFDAFYNAPILSVNNVYEGMKEHDFIVESDSDGIVNEGDLRRSSGCYSAKSTERFENGQYVLDDIKRAVFINQLDLKKDWQKAVLIHELGHLVKAYIGEYTINGNIKINKSGLIRSVSRIDGLNDYTLIEEKGVGLEEGLNTALEETVTRKLVDPDYKANTYGVVCAMGNKFLELCGKEKVYKAQISGNKEELITYFDEKYGMGSYEMFENMADKAYELALEAFSYIFDPPKMNEAFGKVRQIINEEYWPFVNECEKKTMSGETR